MASFLGIDTGSVSASLALVDAGGGVIHASHRAHLGRVRETLADLIRELGPTGLQGISFTSSTPRVLREGRSVDSHVALITAAQSFFPGARSILYAGGEKFGLVRLDTAGRYRGARVNSSCAAGTGSFLDQQARRLGLAGVEDLARRALACTSPAPKISTRCAVFARTDLVHAQQEGYSLEEICDGLSMGLARNIADTLLGGEEVPAPAVFAGGVSRNEAVRKHLERILGVPLLTHEHSPVFGAVGAALLARQRGEPAGPMLTASEDLLVPGGAEKHYAFQPLSIEERDLSGNNGEERWRFTAGRFSRAHPVEVDSYRQGAAGETPGILQTLEVRLGIDIGSTSTKAMLIDEDGTPVAGFYTGTQGSPLTAVQALCEAMEDFGSRRHASFRVVGAAVTGAGRKLIGAVIKADLVVDEITAHARAAYSLDPEIDTIIEIGGQDAKFTTMSGGMVTFSHMNTVCAAGTGSFLEEQAARLGCGLEDYERRVRGACAPLSSDRCAVFMERDINNFLSEGYSTEEILAAALHSVRDNYLTKVARGASIGRKVAFQGATARNGALVAAFREALGAPVLVSRYCHLTGALGAALLLAEKKISTSTFVGLPALRDDIPVRAETCGLCANHCRLRICRVGGEDVAYGFLCGRDFAGGRYVDRNRSGFDLIRERKRAFEAVTPEGCFAGRPVIGIPAALGLYGDLPAWKVFFSALDLPVITSEDLDDAVERGRAAQGAEFCAPIAALHGHAAHLLGRADWVFLPVHMEESRFGSKQPRFSCYYTQFSSALASAVGDLESRERFLMPEVSWTRRMDQTKRELRSALRKTGLLFSRARVSAAWRQALQARIRGTRLLQKRFRTELASARGPSVVLLGRPYNVLPPQMSKSIPGIFGSLGVKTFFQDMLPYTPRDVRDIEPLLAGVHWHHAAKILEAASVTARTPGLYAVFVTSFKCAPDSIAIEYVRRIMDAAGKPYLVLQLDDHDSTLGYETRIEAGVAAFRNHMRRPTALPAAPRTSLPYNPRVIGKIHGKTLLFPVWDPLVNPLLAAGLRREGVDARVLEEDQDVIRASMRHNTGQCIPLNVIAEEAARYVQAHGLDPAKTAVWMAKSQLSCNIGMFPFYIKSLLEARGGGMDKVDVYGGSAFYLDFSLRATFNAYRAYLAGGLLRRLGCKLRPREKRSGDTDHAVARSMEILIPAFEGKKSIDAAFADVASLFQSIPVNGTKRPKVAIFGDLYVRDNDIMNQGLIACLEAAGAEVITTPYTEYVRIVASSYFRKWLHAGEYAASFGYRALWKAVDAMGGKYAKLFEPLLGPPGRHAEDGADRIELIAKEFGVRSEHAGESFDNLLKVTHLAQAHPDLALFVQASPAFCCPSLVTEAMARDIERITGVPVVNITYDGTGQYRNDAVVPYIAYAASRS
ncbi:MAG TPA: acyl-CoA dehydratase activase [Spirochaetia bacterium]|nr:acyl-CoA dehydratase activase [Spirochaetia bacterium]